MTTFKRRAAAVCLVGLLLGCGSGSAPRPASGEDAQVSVAVQAVGSGVAMVVLTVTAADMGVPLVFNMPIEAGTAEATVAVPPGPGRRFTAEAYDAAGTITHDGTASADISRGQNDRVSIPMVPRGARVPVDVTIGAVAITVAPAEHLLEIGGTVTISATVRSASGAVLDVTPSWASSKPGVATVDDAGNVTAVGAGVTDVVASYAGSAAWARITVSSTVAPVPAPLVIEIEAVPNTPPGGTPSVDFRVLYDGVPRDILTWPLSMLRFILAGPTTDYASYSIGTIQAPSAVVGTLTAIDAAGGRFRYVLPPSAAIAATANGSYALGLEGYITLDTNERIAAPAAVAFFAVTDTSPVARREIVSEAACNVCHGAVRAHGGSRRGMANCLLCHAPPLAAEGYVARVEGENITAPSLNFKGLIHAIHRGGALVAPYVVWRFPGPMRANPYGSPYDYSEAPVFPGDLAACTTCHLAGTYSLPLRATAAPSREVFFECTEDPAADADMYCDSRNATVRFVRPVAAACTSCHDSVDAVVHAQVNTNSIGQESCATCHGPGRTFAH